MQYLNPKKMLNFPQRSPLRQRNLSYMSENLKGQVKDAFSMKWLDLAFSACRCNDLLCSVHTYDDHSHLHV